MDNKESDASFITSRARMRRWPGRLIRGFAIVYIALIGILAIEELQRRDKVLALLTARENELAAALAPNTNADDPRRLELEKERREIQGLRARTTTLIVGGSIQPKTRPLKDILCELTKVRASSVTCDVDDAHRDRFRDFLAEVALKRTAEQRSSGDVFAFLIVIAAIGGALIRLYLPGEDEHDRKDDAFRRVLRATGGGVVCYLAITGGSIPLSGTSMTAYTSPATGALLGLLAGMFSTKVFQLLSSVVDTWVGKLMPADKRTDPAAKVD